MQICVVLRRGWMLKSSNNLEIATEYWNGSTQKNGTVLGRRLSQRECGSQRECCRPSPMIWVWCLTLTWRKPDVLVCICIPSTSYSKMEDRDKRISQFLGQLAPSTQLSIGNKSGPVWARWRERADSRKLSSDYHRCAMVPGCPRHIKEVME